MKKYTRKPTVIEAEQFTQEQIEGYLFDDKPLPRGVKLSRANYHRDTREIISAEFFVVTIHRQSTKIVPGDWIMPELDGLHFYPCKPDVFAATYEEVK